MRLLIKKPARLQMRVAMLAACMVLAAGTLAAQSERVVLNARTLTLREAFAQIEQQTGYVLAFANKMIDTNRKVTLPRTDSTVKDILASLLAGTGQTYEMQDNYIILRPAVQPQQSTAGPVSENSAVIAAAVRGVSIAPISQQVVLTPVMEPDREPWGNYPYARNLNATPGFALKNNLLADAIGTINLAGEIRLTRKTTLDVGFGLNPWTWDKQENTKWKYLKFQPEYRWWLCEAFNGHFFGLHAHWAYFNFSRLPSPPFSDSMHDYRYQGNAYGAGISYGYQFFLAPRWGAEVNAGAGFAILDYDKYPCQTCGKRISDGHKIYWGPTRAAFNLVYYF